MRFGIFYEHQLPRPWEQGSERQLLHDALEQVQLADRLGFDYVWEVEHHFLEEYSHSSAPEVFLAAAAALTERIRIGHGIVQLPPAVNHPARVAERIATLDLISDGRVEFGTGESSSASELGGFGVDRERKREMWRDALDAITRMFVEEPFVGWDSEFVAMPPRNVVPKPLQKPHPPLWVACSRRETIELAAQVGAGALSFSFVEPEDAGKWVDEYYAIIESERCVPAGFAVNANVSVVLPMMLAPNEAEAIERGIDGAHFFGYSLAHFYGMTHQAGVTDVWTEFEQQRDETGFARHIVTPQQAPLGVKLLQEGLGSLRGAIGDPGQVTELLRRYQAAGVDQVIFVLQAGRNRHEHIVESLELFAREVMPQFVEGREQREKAKAERLAPAIAAALARREPARTLDAPYTVDEPAEVARAQRARPRPRPRADAGDRVAALAQIGAQARTRAQQGVRAAFARYVRAADDLTLDRRFGSRLVQRALFDAMARSFDPASAGGFEGRIVYKLRRRDPTAAASTWTVEVRDGKATAVAGDGHDPSVTLRMAVVDFARIAAGTIEPLPVFLEGRATVEGDLAVAARLSEMFGGPSPY
jgi:alkanesulfonate monooxygenase SsuD/methylene tetrahydromethanopterin reductase-like flavin-dependent oxidoreductase (luciferase family)